MKKLLIGCMIIGVLFVAAEAKNNKIFDLKDQYFSGTLIKKGQEGYGVEQRYDVGKAIVTTNTKLFGASYMYGIFTVDIKEPLKEWNVNIKKKNGVGEEHQLTAIRLTSNKGNNYFITFDGGEWSNQNGENSVIQINNKEFKIKNLNGQILTVSATLQNSKTVLYINGKSLLVLDAKTFGNLEKVEVELNDNRYNDKLLALDIYEVK